MSKALAPILFLITAIGLFFTYIRPAYDVLLAFQAQEQELDSAIMQSENLLKTFDTLMISYSSISQQHKMRLNKILPQAIDVVHLILDIDSIASRNKVKINSFVIPQLEGAPVANSRTRNAPSAKDEGPVGSAVLTIECEGDYFDVKAMLFEVERSLTLTDVVQLDVEVADMTKAGTKEGVKYTIGLRSYWLK